MGNIEKYQKQGKTFYKFKVYTGINPKTGKKSQTTRSGFTTKAAATAERRKIQAQVADGTYWDDDIDAPKTVGELMDEFIKLRSQAVRSSTLRTYYQAKKVFSNILDVKIEKLGVADILEVVETNKKFLCPDVLNRYLGCFKQAYAYAFSQGYVKRNIMEKIPKIKYDELKNEKKIEVYSLEELSVFLKELKKYNFKTYVISRILVMGGLRIGEACVLTWDDIDEENCVIRINKTSTVLNGSETVGVPKTKNSNRSVSVDKTTIKELTVWKELHPSKDYIFPKKNGGFYNTSTFRNTLKNFYRHHPEIKKLSPHELRHTHASLLFEKGINPKVIQERLGHESIETTLDIYVHLNEDNNSISDVLNVLNNIDG